MALEATPKRSERRRTGRPATYSVKSEPLRKKRKYVRRAEKERLAALEASAPRSRGGGGRRKLDEGTPDAQTSPAATVPRARRDRPVVQPRFSSASAAATALTQNEGYKPREERGWEEFHPELDIEAELLVFGAEEVDGYTPGATTPLSGISSLPRTVSDGIAITMMTSHSAGPTSLISTLSFSGIEPPVITPFKRRPGRPPKSQSMLSGLGSPPAPRIVPLPTHNPKERLNLPKPNYRHVQTFASYEKDKSVGVNYVDKSMANLGFQESDQFLRSERTYIRGTEGSLEEELDIELGQKMLSENAHNGAVIGRVEYDMDEQDEHWLNTLNAERKTEGVEPIKPAIFEITMTMIEKEWHALEKRIPKPSPKQPQTQRPRSGSAAAVNGEPADMGEEPDSKCAICDDGDCENANAIVFCDGCDLAVHQECYGVPFIPEGQWLCRKCQLIGRGTPTCMFCPNIEGAFKQTNTLKWAHLICSLWVPEVTIANITFMEPITDIEKIPKQRWRLFCYICKQQMGACVQCANKNCYTAFHVTCGRRANLFLKMKNHNGNITDHASYKALCNRHVPTEWRKEHDTERAFKDAQRFYSRTMKNRRWADSQQAALAAPVIEPTENLDGLDGDPNDPLSAAGNNKRKKAALQKKIWRLPGGAPIVPEAVFLRIENAMVRFALRQRKQFVAEACKYWSLKREARRGAPLIKRFQASMDTFTSMEITRRNFAAMGATGRTRLDRRIDFAEYLEGDIEQLRQLCHQIKDREVQKVKDGEILRQLVDSLYFPVVPLLRPIFEKVQGYDTNGKLYFRKGLNLIRERMSNRAIISIIDFVILLGKAFSEAIASADGGESLTEEDDASKPKNALALEKDKRSRAKRITNLIKPMLQDAVRKESELGKKDFDAEWQRIDTILKDSTAVRLNSAGAASVFPLDHTPLDPELLVTPHEDDARKNVNGINGRHEPLGSIADLDGLTGPVALPATDSGPAAQQAQLIDTSLQAPNTARNPTMSHDSVGGNVPALSHSGSTVPSVTREPLTPPTLTIESPDHDQGKDLLAPLRNGGVAWYLAEFEPQGTTIHDPDGWDGRKCLRNMSEELSDMDDEAVDGLMKDDAVDVDILMVDADAEPSANTLQVVAEKTKRATRLKRKRAW